MATRTLPPKLEALDKGFCLQLVDVYGDGDLDLLAGRGDIKAGKLD